MGASSAYTDTDRARSWLIQQRLPHHDADAVLLVAARLAARRRGRWFDGLLFLGFLLACLVWLYATDARPLSPSAFTAAVMVVAMSIVLLRRSLLWWRLERGVAAQLHGRVAALDRPTWARLVGWPAVLLLTLVSAAALVAAASSAVHESGRGARVVLVSLGVVYTVVLLELARRRSVLAGDALTFTVDRRLRVAEAVDAVGTGAIFIAIVPLPFGASNTGTVLSLAGYGLLCVTAWWNSRHTQGGLVAAPDGAR
jgi:hypothetical protein